PGVGSSWSPRNASDGRVPHRLGSGHEWPPHPRSVERSPSSLAHQLPGDAGHVSGITYKENPDSYGPGLLRAGPSGAEWGPPHSTVPVSPQCPREISLPTLPVFQGAVDAALAPLRLQGIRILSYIDWLILAQSEHMAAQHRDVVLAHMKELGLRLNAKKSVLSPLQRTTYLGVVHVLSPARIESILSAVTRVTEGRSLTVKQFQRLLGLMAAASNVIPFGLLYMRPLQWWLRTKGFSPRGNPFRMIKVTRQCLRALDMWKKPWFLSQGPVLGAPCSRVTLATDTSLTGWGAVMNGHPAHGLWSGRHLTWHINCLEMLAVFRALKHFLPDRIGRHVLVRADNTAVVYYINHQGGLRSRPLYKLAHQILVWSQGKLLLLRAVHVPGHLNMGADVLSRQGPRPGEWMLHPEVVKQIWRVFGQAQVDLFATQENAQCPLWFSLIHPAPLGLDAMVQMWPRLHLYAFPPIALLPGVLERVRRDGVRLLLVAPYWPARAWFSDLISLLDDSLWEIPVRSRDGNRKPVLVENRFLVFQFL
ncbi:hypothetical protein M9458_041735, partial [Cirrhinus mrigala]